MCFDIPIGLWNNLHILYGNSIMTAQNDLAILKSEIQTIKLQTFTLMQNLLSYTPEQLPKIGHKHGVAEALASSMTYALRQITKLEKEYLKKYPD